MQVRNGTPFDVQVQIAAPRGERLASVIIKSTYDLRMDSGARLATEQMPLVTKYRLEAGAHPARAVCVRRAL
jgi:hypothetical protein